MHLEIRSAESIPLAQGTPTAPVQTFVKQVATALAATGLLALCAHISFPLPLTPVPVTMQTFGVLLIGLLLDPALATCTMLLYLVEGAVGLPVFSPHGLGGLLQLSGPSAGYLLSYPLAALITAHLFASLRHSLPTVVASGVACVVASAFVLICGSVWLMALLHTPLSRAFQLGVLPFLAGEAFKIVLLAGVLTIMHPSKSTR